MAAVIALPDPGSIYANRLPEKNITESVSRFDLNIYFKKLDI